MAKVKLTEDRKKRFLDAILAGATRIAACGAAHFSKESLRQYMMKFPRFREEVEDAEHQVELRFTAIIMRAAMGHMVTKERVVSKPVVIRYIDAKGQEHTKEETVRETISETYLENDWRAALEWLKRRRRKDWGDNVQMDLDKEIQSLIDELQAPLPSLPAPPEGTTLQ